MIGALRMFVFRDNKNVYIWPYIGGKSCYFSVPLVLSAVVKYLFDKISYVIFMIIVHEFECSCNFKS